MQTTVSTTEILLLADGDSAGAQANARGHLFESFVAHLMGLFGYEQPTKATLNNTSNGIELDVTATHQLTRQKMIAECKAYTSPLAAKELSSFYGKLGAERFACPDLFGYFVALPRLTKDARELQAKIESKDAKFRVYTADALMELLLERGKIVPLAVVAAVHEPAAGSLSDHALLVTVDGLFYAAHDLEPTTRLAKQVVAYPALQGIPVPQRVLELLTNATAYTKGLSCLAATGNSGARVQKSMPQDDTVIEVTGSSSDFEYQFPAAPKYFVGRQTYVEGAEQLLQDLTRTDSRAQVLVFNAQSGWGKSSLALRLLAIARSLKGTGVCVDCRTATHATFASAALRHGLIAAQAAGVLTLPRDSSFATVSSSLQTLKNSRFSGAGPICLFFDQFENVFQNPALTREFRDLALGVVDIQAPLLIGFSWKTDFVAFTESYPYQLRDDIRSGATVFSLTPFGPAEIGELIGRLQKSCGQKIHPYLRERIREYSQGLPWLFKKLGSHIIREIGNGITQDKLLSDVLNIQNLFESDISGLNVNERQALKAIARRAPLPVLEAVDLASCGTEVVQSLLNQRLLVSIGEKLDIYWDVFRDYLNQGSVPLLDSYVLRLTPNSISKLLINIQRAGGATTPDIAATELNTSVISVLNMARDLRQLGVLAAQEGILRFSDDVAAATDLNTGVMTRAAIALKRHRVYSLLTSLAPTGGRLPMTTFAEALPKAYPAVEAKRHSWSNYSRAFAYWFQYAGLATLEPNTIVVGKSAPIALNLMLPGKKRAGRGMPTFPRAAFPPSLALLKQIAARHPVLDSSTTRKALADVKLLGLVAQADDGRLSLSQTGQAIVDSNAASSLVSTAIQEQLAFRIALPMLLLNPACPSIAIGRSMAAEMKVDWADATAAWTGKFVRNWMRAAGVPTAKARSKPPKHPSNGDLFATKRPNS